jgi:hypothetical protein
MDALFLTTFVEIIAFIMWAAFWILVIWLFVWLFGDVFRRRDLSGWGKAGWVLAIFFLPLLGALIYIGVRPKYGEDYDPDIAWAPAKGAMSPAEEVAYAHTLLEQGTITQAEFDEIKRKTL